MELIKISSVLGSLAESACMDFMEKVECNNTVITNKLLVCSRKRTLLSTCLARLLLLTEIRVSEKVLN